MSQACAASAGVAGVPLIEQLQEGEKLCIEQPPCCWSLEFRCWCETASCVKVLLVLALKFRCCCETAVGVKVDCASTESCPLRLATSCIALLQLASVQGESFKRVPECPRAEHCMCVCTLSLHWRKIGDHCGMPLRRQQRWACATHNCPAWWPLAALAITVRSRACAWACSMRSDSSGWIHAGCARQ